jgi:RNA polymerase sigma factor (sigma-70 family)
MKERMMGHAMASADTTSGTRVVAGWLEDLYVRHAPAALRLAFFLTGDRELAQDLVQDAFVRIAGRFGHLRTPDAFEAYLRRTIVNLFTSHLRRLRLERADGLREPGSGVRHLVRDLARTRPRTDPRPRRERTGPRWRPRPSEVAGPEQPPGTWTGTSSTGRGRAPGSWASCSRTPATSQRPADDLGATAEPRHIVTFL